MVDCLARAASACYQAYSELFNVPCHKGSDSAPAVGPGNSATGLRPGGEREAGLRTDDKVRDYERRQKSIGSPSGQLRHIKQVLPGALSVGWHTSVSTRNDRNHKPPP